MKRYKTKGVAISSQGESSVSEGYVYEAINGSDAIIIMTEWNEYRGLDFDRLKETMRGNAFIDLRNVYDKAQLTSLGFSYTCVGR